MSTLSSSLVDAIYSKSRYLVTQILSDGLTSVQSSDSSGMFPVHHAALANSLSILKILLEHGAVIDQRSVDGTQKTALHFAAEKTSSSDMIEYMRDMDASICAVDALRQTPLHIACETGHDEDVIVTLLESGASMTQKDINGKTPAHLAAASGFSLPRFESGTGLCGMSCIQDRDGNTPLHLAVLNNQVEYIESLSSPKQFEIKNNDGKTAYVLASERASPEVLAALNQVGYDSRRRKIGGFQCKASEDTSTEVENDCFRLVDDEVVIRGYDDRRISEKVALDAVANRECSFDPQEKWARSTNYSNTSWCAKYAESPDAVEYDSRRRTELQASEWARRTEDRFGYCESIGSKYTDEQWNDFWSRSRSRSRSG